MYPIVIEVLRDEPVRKRKRTYNRTYREEWQNISQLKDWIEPCRNGEKAYCKVCRVELQPKLDNLKKHALTYSHCTKVSLENGEANGASKNNIDQQELEARIALYNAIHNNMNGSNHLIGVLKKVNAASENSTLGRTKCTKIVTNVLAPMFRKFIKSDMLTADCSFFIDESTDVSNCSFLGVSISYVSKSRKDTVSTFLHLEKLQKKTGAAIARGFKNVLEMYSIEMSNVVAICTDQGSAMVGVHNGAGAILRKDNNNLIAVACTNHILQLACASTKIPDEQSQIRRQEFEQLSLTMEEGKPLKLKGLSTTRWIAHFGSLKRINGKWKVLEKFFNNHERIKNDGNARRIGQLFKNNVLKFEMVFLESILKEVDQLNLMLQKNKVEPLYLRAAIISLTGYLEKLIYHSESTVLMEFPNFPPKENELFQTLNDEDKAKVLPVFKTYVKDLISELHRRMPYNLRFMTKYKVALSEPQPNIEDFLEDTEVKKLYCYNQKLIIIQQYKDLKVKYEHVLGTPTNEEFWVKALDEHQELSVLMLKLVSIPFSNARIERDFSTMNMCKTKVQSRMGSALLNALMVIRTTCNTTKICCEDFPLPPSVLNEVRKSSKYKEKDYKVTDVLEEGEYEEIENVLNNLTTNSKQ